MALNFTGIIFDPNAVAQPPKRGKAPTVEPLDTDERKLDALEVLVTEKLQATPSDSDTTMSSPPQETTENGNGDEEAPPPSIGSLNQQEVRKTFRIMNTQCYKFNPTTNTLDKHHQTLAAKGMHLDFLTKESLVKYQPLLFLAQVVRRTDPKTKREFLQIIRLMGTVFNWVTSAGMVDLLVNELQLSPIKVNNIINRSKLTNLVTHLDFDTFCSQLSTIDSANPELNLLNIMQNNSVLFLSYKNSPKQVLQLCFPQDWMTIERMPPVLFSRFNNTFSSNPVSFFFKDRCKEFGLTVPLQPAVYRTWFLQWYLNTLPSSFPAADTLGAIQATTAFYQAIKKHVKSKSNTAFLTAHIPDSVWNSERFAITQDGKALEFENLNDHPYFKLLVKYRMVIPDTTYPGETVYRTFNAHAMTKMLNEELVRVCTAFEAALPTPIKPAADGAVDSNLTPDQRRAVCMPQLQGLNVVTGLPGNGKTKVIENAVKYYGKDKCFVVSLVASMVVALGKRGIKAYTAAMTINRRWPNSKFDAIYHLDAADPVAQYHTNPILRDAVELVRAQYEQVELLIIDEASNQYTKLMAMLLHCFPNLRSVMFVMDPEQILPIGEGQVGLDLISFFKRNNYPLSELNVNHRMSSSNDASQMLRNDNLLMASKAPEMVFNPEFTSLPLEREGPYLKAYSMLDQIKQDLPSLYKHYPGLKILAFTHETCDKINEAVDAFMLTTLHPNAPMGTRYYDGQVIMVNNNNYARKEVSKRPRVDSDAITNGESFVLGSIRWLSREPTARRWLPEKQATTVCSLKSEKNECLFLCSRPDGHGNIKKICINPGFVNPKDIESGWAMTVDKSQGTEFETVVFILPTLEELTNKNTKRKYQFIDRNRLHVALTRGKKHLIIYGTREVIEMLALRKPDERFTLLADDLTNMTAESGAFRYTKDDPQFEEAMQKCLAALTARIAAIAAAGSGDKKRGGRRKPSSENSAEESTAAPVGPDGVQSDQQQLMQIYKRFEKSSGGKAQKKSKKADEEEEEESSSEEDEEESDEEEEEDSSSASSDDDSSSSSSSEEETKKKKKKVKATKKKQKKVKKVKKSQKKKKQESSSSSSDDEEEDSSSSSSSEDEKKKKKKKKNKKQQKKKAKKTKKINLKKRKRADEDEEDEDEDEDEEPPKKKAKIAKKQEEEEDSDDDSVLGSQAEESDREESSHHMEESDVASSDLEAQDLEDKKLQKYEEDDDEPDTDDRHFMVDDDEEEDEEDDEDEEDTPRKKPKKKQLKRLDGSPVGSASSSSSSDDGDDKDEGDKEAPLDKDDDIMPI